MKNIKLLFVALAAASLSSCSDFLDKYPNYQPSNEGFFTSEKAAYNSEIGLYTVKASSFGDTFYYWDGLTDQLYTQYNYDNVLSIAQGSIGSSTGGLSSEFYGQCYLPISAANEHIANIDGMKNDLFVSKSKEEYKAPAHFFKAYYYFWLTECYGDVPLYKQKLSTIDEYKVAKTPKAEIVDYILEELELAIKYLPNTGYNGKLTKGAALALKAKVLLHNKKYKESAEAAYEVIKSGKFALDPDYFNLFIKKGQTSSKEIMFAYEYLYPEVAHGLARRLVNSSEATPRQEFVDNYRMADGTLPKTKLTEEEYNKKNRDPRLYMTVDPLHYDWKDAQGITVQRETSQTGWFIKKFFDRDITDRTLLQTSGTSEQSLIRLRYADVLLMYAEAKYRLGELTQDVVDLTINAIRKRVGMATVNDITALSSQEQFDLIVYERSVELAFEGSRYLDLKRWNMLGTTLKSLEAQDPRGAKYIWKDTYMLWPFSDYELGINTNLEQNPGYSYLQNLEFNSSSIN